MWWTHNALLFRLSIHIKWYEREDSSHENIKEFILPENVVDFSFCDWISWGKTQFYSSQALAFPFSFHLNSPFISSFFQWQFHVMSDSSFHLFRFVSLPDVLVSSLSLCAAVSSYERTRPCCVQATQGRPKLRSPDSQALGCWETECHCTSGCLHVTQAHAQTRQTSMQRESTHTRGKPRKSQTHTQNQTGLRVFLA